MKTIALAFRFLWSRPLVAALNLLLLALGLATITFLMLVGSQVDRAFARDLRGIDLVVGAKGSPLQLILAGVFHLDTPTGNVPLAEVEALAGHPQVAQVIPLSLGDSYRSFRIVGTTPAYVAHYAVPMAQGRAWIAPLEVLAGAEAARRAQLAPGSTFVGSHGLGASGHAHGDHPYRVVGVLAPCGCAIDRLLLTVTESVWKVHEDATAVDDSDRAVLAAEREVTVALVRYATPLAAVSLPRLVNATTSMQAAAPAVEVTRLLRLLGVGIDVLYVLGGVLLAVSALSLFIALWNAVRERRADLALLRMLGAPPRRLAALVLCEALWLAVLASVPGLALGHAMAELAGRALQSAQSLPLTGATWFAAEALVPLAAMAVAALAALLPVVSAYRVEPAVLLRA